MGKEGEGWKVAMATLTFERGATGGQAGGLSMMDLSINDVVELARRAKRNGRPAIEDPHVRAELVDLITESRSNGLMATRSGIPALASDWPSSVSMSGITFNGVETSNVPVRNLVARRQRCTLCQ